MMAGNTNSRPRHPRRQQQLAKKRYKKMVHNHGQLLRSVVYGEHLRLKLSSSDTGDPFSYGDKRFHNSWQVQTSLNSFVCLLCSKVTLETDSSSSHFARRLVKELRENYKNGVFRRGRNSSAWRPLNRKFSHIFNRLQTSLRGSCASQLG